NSSRNSRRSDFGEREYRANRAPFTTSGRSTRANTGPSRLVKCGARMARSSSVKSSSTKSNVGSPGEGGMSVDATSPQRQDRAVPRSYRPPGGASLGSVGGAVGETVGEGDGEVGGGDGVVGGGDGVVGGGDGVVGVGEGWGSVNTWKVAPDFSWVPPGG